MGFVAASSLAIFFRLLFSKHSRASAATVTGWFTRKVHSGQLMLLARFLGLLSMVQFSFKFSFCCSAQRPRIK
jgi:hypothetical protein